MPTRPQALVPKIVDLGNVPQVPTNVSRSVPLQILGHRPAARPVVFDQGQDQPDLEVPEDIREAEMLPRQDVARRPQRRRGLPLPDAGWHRPPAHFGGGGPVRTHTRRGRPVRLLISLDK